MISPQMLTARLSALKAVPEGLANTFSDGDSR
jgi:hypothetical protein